MCCLSRFFITPRAQKRLCFHIYDNAVCLCSFNHAQYWKPHKYGSYPVLYLWWFMRLSESFTVFRGKLSAWPWHICPKLTAVCIEELMLCLGRETPWLNPGQMWGSREQNTSLNYRKLTKIQKKKQKVCIDGGKRFPRALVYCCIICVVHNERRGKNIQAETKDGWDIVS